MKAKKSLVLMLISFTSFLAVVIFLRNNNLANSFFSLFAVVPYYDKISHFVLMGILAFLAVMSISPLLSYSRTKSTLIVLGTVLTLVAIEEYSQLFIATRTFSLADFVCDFFGVAIFGSIGHLSIDKRQESKNKAFIQK